MDEAGRQLGIDKEKGFDIAVDNCIKKGILKEYLRENRRKVMSMFFSQFDMHTELKVVREESYDEGRMREMGRKTRYYQYCKKMLEMNLSLEDIERATGLSMAEIERL